MKFKVLFYLFITSGIYILKAQQFDSSKIFNINHLVKLTPLLNNPQVMNLTSNTLTPLIHNFINNQIQLNNITSSLNKEISLSPLEPNLFQSILTYGGLAGIAKCNTNNILNGSCPFCQGLASTSEIQIHILENSIHQTKGVLIIDHLRRRIILVFRGTETQLNLIQDFNLLMSSWNYDKDDKLKVHTGFNLMMESFNDQLNSLLLSSFHLNPQTKSYTFYYIGHSLGGAITLLTALKHLNEYQLSSNNLNVFTFGQPRVGNLEFAKYINSKLPNYYRMVNYNDPVPHAPPRLFGYFHGGKEVFQNGNQVNLCNYNTLEDKECGLGTSPDLDRKLHSKFWSLDFTRQC